MWLVELLLLSLVAGTMLGVGMRMFDEWKEKYGRKAKSVIQVDTKRK